MHCYFTQYFLLIFMHFHYGLLYSFYIFILFVIIFIPIRKHTKKAKPITFRNRFCLLLKHYEISIENIFLRHFLRTTSNFYCLNSIPISSNAFKILVIAAVTSASSSVLSFARNTIEYATDLNPALICAPS